MRKTHPLFIILLTVTACTTSKVEEGRIVVTEYYDNGMLKSRVEMNKDSILDGRSDDYYPNGNHESIMYFKNEKPEGKMTIYYESGKVRAIINYLNGKQNGKALHFYESGNKESESNFYQGKEAGYQYYYFDNEDNSLKYECYVYLLGDKRKNNSAIEYNEKGQVVKQTPYIQIMQLNDSIEITLNKPSRKNMTVIVADYDYLFRLRNKQSVDTIDNITEFKLKLPYATGDTIRGYIDNWEYLDENKGISELIHFSYPEIWN